MALTPAKQLQIDMDLENIYIHWNRLTAPRPSHQNRWLNARKLAIHCPLHNCKQNCKQEEPEMVVHPISFGRFGVLPIELQHMVLLDLDLQSLTEFQAVSQSARATVESLPQYANLVKHAPNAIRAALSVNVASEISVRSLHNALCSKACVSCGHFGGFLYLLSCSRVCYQCLTEKDEFCPLSMEHARCEYALDAYDLASVPKALSIPGTYSTYLVSKPMRVLLVDRGKAAQAALKVYRSHEIMRKYVNRSTYLL